MTKQQSNGGNAHLQDVLSSLNHQLRTPLSVIRMDVDLLSKEISHLLKGEHLNMLDEIQLAVEGVQKYVEDVMYVGYLEGGSLQRQPEDVNMANCIDSILSMHKPLAADRDISIKRDYPAKIVFLFEDPHLIRLVLDPIIANATHYSPEGGIIGISLSKDKNHITVCISDQGPGIPEKIRRKIFLKDFRGKKAKTRHPSGSGLGLNLSKRAMDELIGGSLVVQDNEGGGTIICCKFPNKN